MYIFEGDNVNISLLNEASLPVGLARSVVAAKASKSNTKARFMATSGPCSDRCDPCGVTRVVCLLATSGPCSDRRCDPCGVSAEDLGLGLGPSVAAARVAAGGRG